MKSHRSRKFSSGDGAGSARGISRNPGGRPRGMTAGRANRLALNEAYRMVPVREGDKVLTMPAFQAVPRSLIAFAAKGNGPSQRTLFGTLQMIERERAAQAAIENKAQADKPQVARRGCVPPQ